MRTLFKFMFLFCAACAALGLTALVVAALSHHGHAGWQPDFSLSVNGDDVDLDGFNGPGWLVGLIVTGVVGLVLGVVLPLVLLLGIGLPLLIVGVVIGALVLAVCGVGAVLCSPFVLFGLLALWLIRPRRAAKLR
ncbi:MAG: hypothetical protein JO224_08315 [Pelomonas sp.]|nr:hypothetical protein [Roseateles sp.]